MNRELRQAMLDGMDAQRELRWASRHINPNTTFTKVMGWVMGIVSLLLIAAVAQEPQGWPILFLAALFGAGALGSPAVVRDDLRKAEEAKAIVEKWNQRIDKLKEKGT